MVGEKHNTMDSQAHFGLGKVWGTRTRLDYVDNKSSGGK